MKKELNNEELTKVSGGINHSNMEVEDGNKNEPERHKKRATKNDLLDRTIAVRGIRQAQEPKE